MTRMTARSASSRTSVRTLRIAHRHPTERETGASQHEQRGGSKAKPSATSVGPADELGEHPKLLGLAEPAVGEEQAHEERDASEEGGDAGEEEEGHGAERTQERSHSPPTHRKPHPTPVASPPRTPGKAEPHALDEALASPPRTPGKPHSWQSRTPRTPGGVCQREWAGAPFTEREAGGETRSAATKANPDGR